MKPSIIAAAAALALLSACGEERRDSGVTAAESEELNETENMLDAPPPGDLPMDDIGETGELPVTDEAATNEQ